MKTAIKDLQNALSDARNAHYEIGRIPGKEYEVQEMELALMHIKNALDSLRGESE